MTDMLTYGCWSAMHSPCLPEGYTSVVASALTPGAVMPALQCLTAHVSVLLALDCLGFCCLRQPRCAEQMAPGTVLHEHE